MVSDEHQSCIFNALSTVETSHLHLLEVQKSRSTDVLEELEACISGHAMQDAVGIQLVHQHFRIHDDECVYQHVDHVGKRIISEVGAYAHGGYLPYMWKLHTADGAAQFRPIEYLTAPTAALCGVSCPQERERFDSASRQLRRLKANEAFLREYATLLQQFGVEDVLGLSLCVLPACLKEAATDPATLILESQPEERMLVLSPKLRATLAAEESTITTKWEFVGSAGNGKPVQVGCYPIYGCAWAYTKHVGRRITGHSIG
jgi:hypothetical protein